MLTPQSANPPEALLARYLANDCSPAEQSHVEEWLARGAANRALLEELRLIWNARTQEPGWDTEEIWRNVRPSSPGRIAAPSTDIALTNPFRQRSRQMWAVFAAAAALLLVVGLLTQRERLGLSSKKIAVTPLPMREYVTRRGEMATIQLTDSTQLVLAAESKLRIPADFGETTREVFLDGEAFIDVAHDPARPFRVHLKHAVAQDVGTRFDIRAYENDSLATVAVAQGAVALAPSRPATLPESERSASSVEGILLRAGYVGTLGAGGRASSTRDPFIARRFAWTDGRIQFTDSKLSDVVRDIGRWYDVDVRVADDDLSTRRVTASFSIQSVDQMVEALGLAVHAKVEHQGRLITLRNKS